MDTGFVSPEQEKYLQMNQPELYHAVLKKWGSYGKKQNPNKGRVINKNIVRTKRSR